MTPEQYLAQAESLFASGEYVLARQWLNLWLMRMVGRMKNPDTKAGARWTAYGVVSGGGRLGVSLKSTRYSREQTFASGADGIAAFIEKPVVVFGFVFFDITQQCCAPRYGRRR
jgi:hypothetical protein